MKKQFYLAVMLIVFISFAKAQSSNCQLLAVPSYSATITCNSTITVSGSVSLKYYSTDPPGYNDFCPGAQISVQLQYQSGGVWYNMGSAVTVNNGNTWSRTATVISANYRVVATVVNAGSYCNCSPTYTSGSTYLTFQTAPSATFKVDGQTVNASTYTQIYSCSSGNAQMTDITWTGTNSSYGWKVEVIRTSDGLPKSTSWFTGTPTSPFDLRAFIITQYTTLPGQYTVKLWVKNACNTTGVAYTGLIQINTTPVACVKMATNSGCSSFVNLGSSASNPASVCYTAGPRINATCSGGDWVGGYFNLLVLEFDANNQYVKTVVSSTNNTLNSLNDLQCLDLNYYSNPPLYFFNNHPVGYKWALFLTVGNSCGSSQASGYFVTNNMSCKTDGEDETTAIDNFLPEKVKSFNVYPNPTANELNVIWPYNAGIPAEVKLYSIDGKQLNVPVQSTGFGQLKLDVSGLVKGLYSLELNNGSKQVRKVIIE